MSDGTVAIDYASLHRSSDLRKDHPLYQLWRTVKRRNGSRVYWLS